MKTKEEADEPLMMEKKSVVDEDWRGSCWWRVKIEEDAIDDGKRERERQRVVDEESKTEDWTLKFEEKNVDAGEKTRSLLLLMKRKK